jgi:periplasmic protein TonB
MNRNHLFPAAVAIAAHVFFLFGFTSPKRPPVAPPAAPEPAFIDIVPPPVDDPPMEDLMAGPPAPSEATSVPSLPEPAAVERVTGITIPIPERIVAPLGPPVNKVPTSIGLPNPGPVDGGARPKIFDPSQLDNSPKATFQPAPAYPFEQKRLGISGTVTVSFTVDPTGRVRDPHVVHAEPSGFEEAALRAVSRWRFEPGRKNGRTVPFRMSIPIMFNIQDER